MAPNDTLTAIAGITVGHARRDERPTGCTAVLTEGGVIAGVDVRGGAPGTRELALLDPAATNQGIHGLLLAGGSAFGLAAADGVVRYLEERGIGFDVGVARVPIVPAAILFDLAVGDRPDVRPTAEDGYRAAAAASAAPVEQGNAGAGAGASVGKLGPPDRRMRGGLGSAAIRIEGGPTVAARVAVNALGDIVDPQTGTLVAGTRDPAGTALADARALLRRGAQPTPMPGRNTTIGVVATDARLSKAQATKIAQMAHDGLARTIVPAHTPWDGDTLFALATGARDEPVDPVALTRIGALAAEVTARAVLRGVLAATGLPGLPAARDLAAPG